MNVAAFALGSVAFLINLYANYYQERDLGLTLQQLDHDANLPRVRSYDFIIVGGGAGGCILANRLSKQYSVLLLEAGGTPVPATQTLIHLKEVYTNPRINHVFGTTPQPQTGRVLLYPTGKMLGGSTSHNGPTYNRGNPLDYDAWAKTTNDSSWTYGNVLKYFRRVENYTGLIDSDSPSTPAQHGHSGPVTLSTSITPLLPNWFRAGLELGYPVHLDPNGPQRHGFVAESAELRRGRRVSSYTAYIRPVERRRAGTLRVERYSVVSQVLTQDKRAYGVKYRRHGIPQLAHARQQVILSAGAFGSPLLLMKSGIGPGGMLKEAGIPLVADLPVGVNLHEHSPVYLEVTVQAQGRPDLLQLRWNNFTEGDLKHFFNHGTGPLVTRILKSGQAYIVSSRAKRDGQVEWPDLKLVFNQKQNEAAAAGDPNGDGAVEENGSRLSFVLGVGLYRPKSSGSLRLNTTAYEEGVRNDEELAIVDVGLLKEPSDADVMLEGVKLAVRVMENTTAFKKVDARIEDPIPKLKACAPLTPRSDEYWRCVIRQTVTHSFHGSSTCPMGFGASDKGSVLDSKFNVVGVGGLKVVDASSMPANGVNTNPTATIYMMAEKAAVEIIQDTRAKQTWK